MDLTWSYDLALVALSIGIAIFASFTALNLAGRLRIAEGRAGWPWLLTASLALGGGTWSMHFVGMLASGMPGARYDAVRTITSLVLPIIACGIGLHIVSRFRTTVLPVMAGGALTAAGIVGMHYTGMSAMQVNGMSVSYDPTLVAASVLVAFVAATAALWLAFNTRGTRERVAAAVVMGLAISGMHYTGMAAARVTMHHPGTMDAAGGIDAGMLALSVATATSVLLLLALLSVYLDRRFATLTAHEATILKASEKRYRALIESASDIIAIMDRTGKLTYESSSARKILGYDTEEIIGRRITDFVPAEKIPDVETFLDAVNGRPGEATPGELAVRDKGGRLRELEVVAKNLLEDPAIGGIVLNLRDITDRKRLIYELERLSETDMLTGTLNRRGFLKRAERDFKRLRRTRKPAAMVMIDVDHFKHVNDTYGHAAGDMVLAMVVERCRVEIRTTDLLGRFGGEEFVMMLCDSPPESIPAVVERLRRAIAMTRISTIRGEVSVTASFGIAVVDASMNDLETAIRFADEALYDAKNSGRNCIRMRAA